MANDFEARQARFNQEYSNICGQLGDICLKEEDLQIRKQNLRAALAQLQVKVDELHQEKAAAAAEVKE